MNLSEKFIKITDAYARMEEADLNAESANAAAYYVEKQFPKTMPTDFKQTAMQYIAIGFFMGYRKCEENHKVVKWITGKLSNFGKKWSQLRTSLLENAGGTKS